MKIPITKPAGFDPQAGPATGEQVDSFKISSTIQYKNNFSRNSEKSTCICPTCHATQAFATDYYQNNTILRDNDQLVHIPRVSK